jgi:hypothetical protein
VKGQPHQPQGRTRPGHTGGLADGEHSGRVAAYETEVRAERILAGQAAARERGVRWGGSIRGRRIRATVEQVAVIRRLRSEGGEIASIARATGHSRPTIDRILGEDCHGSSGFSDGEPVGRVVCGTGPV